MTNWKADPKVTQVLGAIRGGMGRQGTTLPAWLEMKLDELCAAVAASGSTGGTPTEEQFADRLDKLFHEGYGFGYRDCAIRAFRELCAASRVPSESPPAQQDKNL